MDKRYQVFVSSTFEDLKDERQAVLKGILELDHMPAGMELFPATDATAWSLICDVIDASDYYVLIIGGSYGSLDKEGIGFTEKEYDYAVTKNKPVISLLHSDPDNLPRGKTETNTETWKKLLAFREKVESRHTCVYWSNASELKAQLIIGLTSSTKRFPAEGWVRASALASQEANRQIVELRDLVDKQKQELQKRSTTPPQGTEKLAQGEDFFEVEFGVTYSLIGGRWGDPDRTIRKTFIYSVTWNELFGAFAADFLEPNRDNKIKLGITRFLRNKFGESIQEAIPNYVPTNSSSISEALFQTIRVQFSALGLLECRMETRTTDGEEKDVRVCSLTPYGQQQLLKVKAVYRDNN